jgi:MFS transporter, PPP family, 3-phenylpropionic acid transporter
LIAFRLSLLYAALFAVVGVQQPFWPVWLQAAGLHATDIGLVLALSIGIKMVSAPAVAHIADGSGERKRLMVLFALIAAVSFGQFAFVRGLWPILLISLVYFGAWPPIVSLAESVTVHAARLGRADYGRVRLWGSFSFIACAALAGQVLTVAPPDAVYWMILGLQVIVLITCLGMPGLRDEPSRSRRSPLVEVLSDRRFTGFLVACGLIQGSHAVYYGFGALAWKEAGYSEAIIGLLWAEAVIAEIILFALGSRLLRRLSALDLIAVAGIAAAVRWIGVALTDTLPALVALQLLHAFSFGAAHLAAMHYIAGSVAPALSATAQSLYSGIVWGLFLGGGLLAAGYLFEAAGVDAYIVMSAPAVAGAVVARRLPRRPADLGSLARP